MRGARAVVARATPPPQAVSAGYTRLAFGDEFRSSSTIAPSRSGSFNWYPASQGNPTFTVNNSELNMTADPTPNGGGLATILTEVKSLPDSSVFRYAYFEARMKYANVAPGGYSNAAGTWPSFFSFNSNWRNRTVNFQEVDFMEGIPEGSPKVAGNPLQMAQTIHTWTANFGADTTPDNWDSTPPNPSNAPALPGGNPGADFSVYHKYGCLWTPGHLVWYFDDVAYTSVTVDQASGYNLESDGDPLDVIIGTGTAFPCTWDWVRVWQRPATTGSEFLTNAALTGGANGSPGTLPTGMATTLLGLTRTISSVGTTDPVTGLPSMTIQFSGTTSGAGNVILFFANGATNAIGAVPTTFSLNVIQTAVSGAGAGNITGYFMETDAGSSNFGQVSIPYNNTVFQSVTGPNASGTSAGFAYWYFSVSGAVAVNVTFRFSGPSFKQQP